MPQITTTRTVTTEVTSPINIELREHSKGVTILVNGERAIGITTEGYLRRYRGLSDQAGVRRLDDGRIAIKSAVTAAE